MSILSKQMCASIAIAAGTQLLPGTRVRWTSQGFEGRVSDLSLTFDGKAITFDGLTVRWDDENKLIHEDSFCVDELHMLEILP